MRIVRGLAVGLGSTLLLYLLLWPTPVRPAAWSAAEAPALSRAFRSGSQLSTTEVLLPELLGPEDIAIDDDGQLTVGLLDGRLVRIDPRTGRFRSIVNTGGRPLGIQRMQDGTLLVADAYKGLLRIEESSGHVEVLADAYRGHRLRFPDEVALLPDGRALFTDASMRFGLESFELDALEHSATGRVFAFDFASRTLSLLADRLVFANGVAVSGDGSYALVSETWAYRVRRLFLSGPRKGQHDVVIDSLPGFPDNISYDAAHGLFWVALASPRDAALDLLAPHPFLRRIIARLPRALQPAAKRHGMALAIRGDGTIVKFLDDPGGDSYSPITSVVAHAGDLYFGSLAHPGIGRARGLGR